MKIGIVWYLPKFQLEVRLKQAGRASVFLVDLEFHGEVKLTFEQMVRFVNQETDVFAFMGLGNYLFRPSIG
ncbi:MAG: hypothetical protein D6732_23410 [Methanobacteriota archaeon]|nr:MAG: hypothetical protein D6732_23410 [Euryarchaeota archaeon]